MTDHLATRLDDYLDGALSLAEQRAFEEQVRLIPRLRAAVQDQRRIDDSLRRLIGAPDQASLDRILAHITAPPDQVAPPAFPTPATPAASEPSSIGRIGPLSPARRAWRWLAVAAMLAITGFGAWSAWNAWNANRIIVPRAIAQTCDSYYRTKIDSGFRPYWKCESQEQFASSFVTRLGSPLLLKTLPEGMISTGIDYTTVISPRTMAVLMKDGQTPVIVLIDTLEADRASPLAAPPASANLHLHRRELGNLALYEITPNAESRVLDLFFNPDLESPADAQRTWAK